MNRPASDVPTSIGGCGRLGWTRESCGATAGSRTSMSNGLEQSGCHRVEVADGSIESGINPKLSSPPEPPTRARCARPTRPLPMHPDRVRPGCRSATISPSGVLKHVGRTSRRSRHRRRARRSRRPPRRRPPTARRRWTTSHRPGLARPAHSRRRRTRTELDRDSDRRSTGTAGSLRPRTHRGILHRRRSPMVRERRRSLPPRRCLRPSP